MEGRARSRWIGVGAVAMGAMGAMHCGSLGPSCTWYSVAVAALPVDFPTCGHGVTPPYASDGGDTAATLKCQSLCAGIANPYGPTGDGLTCCISTWEPDTVVCSEVCED
jgi:hypothetical protein